jgi:hypothetical protein
MGSKTVHAHDREERTLAESTGPLNGGGCEIRSSSDAMRESHKEN